MKLTDIIELAKKGYTPADIRELVNISEETPDNNTPETVEEQNNEAPDNEDDPEAEPEAEPEETEEPAEPDYKKMFETERTRRIAAEKKAAHQESARKEEKSDFQKALEMLNDL